MVLESVMLLLGFIVSLILSTIIIYIVAKLLGETEGFGTALLAALAGAVIFALASYFIGVAWIATLVGVIVWLIAIGSLYSVGWLKAFVIAVGIGIVTTLFSLLLLRIVT